MTSKNFSVKGEEIQWKPTALTTGVLLPAPVGPACPQCSWFCEEPDGNVAATPTSFTPNRQQKREREKTRKINQRQFNDKTMNER